MTHWGTTGGQRGTGKFVGKGGKDILKNIGLIRSLCKGAKPTAQGSKKVLEVHQKSFGRAAFVELCHIWGNTYPAN